MRKAFHTPWSNVLELLHYQGGQDAQGFADGRFVSRSVMCTWENGVSQNEFYLSSKEGHRAAASVELWTVDYQNEEFCRFNGRRYRVVRTFPSSFDCTTLILEEVIR